jgi:hypothetical protein
VNSSFLYPTNVVPILNKNIYIALQYKSQFANGIAAHGIGASRGFSIHPEAALMKAWQRVSMGD